MFPFNYSLPPTPCFYLPWRESCTIWWKKIPLMEREGGVPLLRSQSADLLYSREKNEPTLLEADVDTVSVIEDGKSWLSRCSYKGVLTAVRDPVMDHLPICGRTAEASQNQIWSHSVILTCKRHQRLSLFGVFFSKPFPSECVMDIFQIMLRLERQVKTESLSKSTVWSSLSIHHYKAKTLIKIILERIGYLCQQLVEHTYTAMKEGWLWCLGDEESQQGNLGFIASQC